MTLEEMVIKLTFDVESMKEGTAKARQELEALGGHTKKNAEEFVHAEKPARAFHKVLHEITGISPAVGVGLRLMMGPIGQISAVLIGAALLFQKMGEEAKEATKKVVEGAKEQAKAYLEMMGAASKANETIHKLREDQSKFEVKVQSEKPSVMDAHSEAVERAREVASTEAEFAQSKRSLDAFYADQAMREQTAAMEEEKQAEAKVEDKARMMSLEKAKAHLKGIEELQRTAAEQSFGSKTDVNFWANLGLGPAMAKDMAEQADQFNRMVGKDRRDAMQQAREILETDIRAKETAISKDKEVLEEARGNVMSLKNFREGLQKEETANERKVREADRKDRQEATKDQIEEAKDMAGEDHVKFLQEKMHIEQIALLEAQRLGDKKEAHELERQMHKDKVEMGKVLEDQAKKQRALDEEIKLSKQGLREAEIGSAMPTLKEISGSKDWSSIMVDHYRSQRERDRENPAYLKQFARQAQELELLEEDKAGALRSEGPQSARFKADVSRIRSLQKELSDAGLQKGSPLEKMEEHLRKLYEKAEGEGLIVQAVNAP